MVPALTRYTEIMLGARGAVELADWRIKPKSIAPPDDKRDAEVRKINAETYTLFVQAGVLEPTEIRNSLFGGSDYSANITLDPDITAAIEANKAAGVATEVQTPAGPTEPPPATEPNDFGGVA